MTAMLVKPPVEVVEVKSKTETLIPSVVQHLFYNYKTREVREITLVTPAIRYYKYRFENQVVTREQLTDMGWCRCCEMGYRGLPPQ
jgi:hypothetical protein